MQWDAIWNRARVDLVLTTDRGDRDVFLLEHSCRVAENARQIAKLPEVESAAADEVAIVSGALYHDAGWVARVASGEISREEILVRPMSETHRELGASLLEKNLAKLVPAESLQRAAYAIRTLHDRDSDSIEGQVIAEADSLDEFGVISLWTSVRRGVLDGKGIQAVIDMWRRRSEFRFWDARLRNSFRFPAIRELAQHRLELLERFMMELEEQHKCSDLP